MRHLMWRIVAGGMILMWGGAWAESETRMYRIRSEADSGLTGFTPAGEVLWTNAATLNTNVLVEIADTGQPSDWTAYVQVPITGLQQNARVVDPAPPAGMTLIPAGVYTRGDAFSEAALAERPLHNIYISAFYMDRYEVSKRLWDEVYTWAITNGYGFESAGFGKAINHPVHSINWYDAVKWCNARSEKEEITPAYYTSAIHTGIYRIGRSDLSNDWVNWTAGYRLPTEAEWEKAARGGAVGMRFAWRQTNVIDHTLANYFGRTDYVYNAGYEGYDTNYNDGTQPYTSPIGSFPPNSYGLCDTIGNVSEWTWDRWEEYWYNNSAAHAADSRGPEAVAGDWRGNRGGCWTYDPMSCRVSDRPWSDHSESNRLTGFRTARGISP